MPPRRRNCRWSIRRVFEEGSTERRIADFPLVALLVAVALYVAAATLAFFVNVAVPPMPDAAKYAVEVAVNVALLLAVYKLGIRHLGAAPRDDLPMTGAPKGLALGFAGGAAVFGLVTGAAAAAGVYRITGCCSVGLFVRDLCEATILASFSEELLFRGILFRWIEDFAGSWTALALTAALFGLVHIDNPNATWFSSFAIAVEAGLLLGGAYMLTRSLWAPIGLHAAWNFTQGYVFDIPVSGLPERGLTDATLSGPVLLSGGRFGLEASLFALVVATIAGFVLIVLAVRRGRVVQPWWTRRPEVLA